MKIKLTSVLVDDQDKAQKTATNDELPGGRDAAPGRLA
jgi:hypothetical protein